MWNNYSVNCCNYIISYVILVIIMRILINASTSIGDALYCSFIIDNLYRYYPDASFQILCWSPMATFFRSYPFVEQVINYNHVEKDNKFALFVLRPQVDIFIDMQHTEESAEVARAINAPISIGVNPCRSEVDKYKYTIIPQEGEHIYESFLRGFKTYWPDWDIDPNVRFRIKEQHNIAGLSLLIENGVLPDDDFVILHPGAKGKSKLWDVRKWCDCVEYFYERNIKVVLMGSDLLEWGGQPILDMSLCKEIYNRMMGKCVNLAGETKDILLFAAICNRAKAYIGLDTGTTHLAALLGIFVVTIFKYTDQKTYDMWRPYSEHSYVLKNSNLNEINAEDVCRIIETEKVFI